MKKILFHISTLSGGGAERVIANLANRFSVDGFDVVVVTSFPNDNEYELNSKVKRINLAEKNIGNFFKRNFSLINKLRTVIKQETPNTVISFMAEPNFRLLIASLGLKTKKIISVRNDPNKEYPSVKFKLLAKNLYRLADVVIFQTKDAQNWFPKKIVRKSIIVMNQVDEKFFNSPYEGKRSDIVTTGRLTIQKNHKLLIDAFSTICESIDDNLIIYGEGELRESLEAYISDRGLQNRVFLPGRIDNVNDIIRSAKLFVLSSDYEGMPNSLLEAMALGLPVVSTDCPCGGPRECLKELSPFHLVNTNDTYDLAKSMKYFLSLSDEQIKDISTQTSLKAQNFKSDVVVKVWENIL